MTPRELGQEGEERARRFFEEKGWRCLGQNIRFRRGEIDLVFLDPLEELVFVEVRTRSAGKLQPPETTVGPRKLRRLLLAAEVYVARHRWEGYWRIDLMAWSVHSSCRWHGEHFQDIAAGGMLS